MLRSTHGGGRIHRHHLAGDQPIEQPPHRGELLFHAGRGVPLLKRLYMGGDVGGRMVVNARPRPSHQAKNRPHARE